jgi:hypothetical protein
MLARRAAARDDDVVVAQLLASHDVGSFPLLSAARVIAAVRDATWIPLPPVNYAYP